MKPILKKFMKFYNDMDKWLFWITIIMVVYGLINIVTASSSEAVTAQTTLYHYFNLQLRMILIAIVGGVVLLNVDTKKYSLPSIIAYGGILAVLIYLYLYGTAHRGSVNWIQIGPARFQPSEFAKPVVIVCLSIIFEKFYKKLKNKKISHLDMIGIIFAVGFVFPIIVFLQKDLGTAMILIFIATVMFVTSPVLRKEKLIWGLRLALLIVIAGLILYVKKGYILSEAQIARFEFFNPCQNYEEGGYQTCNGFIAINDGGLIGLGAGKSKQKYSYIPEPHTDSVFAIIVEENGLLLSTIIFIGYFAILKRILMLASVATSIRGRYICIGTASYIFAHIFINLGGLFGIIPLTGVPLPFLSYGGSFIISLLMMLSVVQRVHIETKREFIKKKTI